MSSSAMSGRTAGNPDYETRAPMRSPLEPFQEDCHSGKGAGVRSLQRVGGPGAVAGLPFPSFARDSERTRLDLRNVIGEIEFLLDRVLPKSITVRTKLSANLWPISGDANQISQMLLNLCINARDAMPAGGVLTIAAANSSVKESSATSLRGGSERYVRLTVSDTGCGIPAQAMDRICDPSFTTKEPGAGRGRGLFTVLSVIRGHEGIIRVESSPECGSRFEMFLPAFNASMNPTLLIAEADADLRQAYTLICSARGFDVQTSADGVECLNKLAEAIPHVLIVDLDIPWGGGDGVLACVRQRFVDSTRPFVVVTGGDSLEVISQRSGIPSRNCFAKPFRVSAVLDCVSGTLAGEPRFDRGNGSAWLDTKAAF